MLDEIFSERLPINFPPFFIRDFAVRDIFIGKVWRRIQIAHAVVFLFLSSITATVLECSLKQW